MPESKKIERFNLRVYGLLIVDRTVLITDEKRGNVEMTKFPGGGLEKGEGLSDCLKREFMEELNLEIDVHDLFYTNEFLQLSAFNQRDQLHSFYFRVSALAESKIPPVSDLNKVQDNLQKFRWLDLDEVSENEFTFPLDKIVAEKLTEG